MIVTVQETIEHSRDITAEMVETYMRRRGWREFADDTRVMYIGDSQKPSGLAPWFNQPNMRTIACAIAALAAYEDRPPTEVLADIAEGR